MKIAPLSRIPRRLPRPISRTKPTPDYHTVREEVGEDRRERGDTGGDRDGDGQHVIDQQSAGSDEAREWSQVVAGHDVGTTAGGVGLDRLLIAGDDDRQDDDDDDGDRQRQGERCRAGQNQHAHDLLRRIGRGGDVVRGEDCQPGDYVDALMGLVSRRYRSADQHALDLRSRPPQTASRRGASYRPRERESRLRPASDRGGARQSAGNDPRATAHTWSRGGRGRSRMSQVGPCSGSSEDPPLPRLPTQSSTPASARTVMTPSPSTLRRTC